MSGLSHLDELEAEAIYIIREVAAECEKPVLAPWEFFLFMTFVFIAREIPT